MSTLVEFPGLGLEMTISRVAFSVFGVEVYWYGLIIALGLMVGIGIGFANAKRFGVDADRMTDVILVTVVLAVLCARLYYVIFYPGDYDSLGKILNLRDGGLAIYGGVIGAVVFGWLMCRIRRVPVWAMFDMTAMGFLAGQGIAVRAGLHCAPLAHRSAGTLETGTLRISVSALNTPEECFRFLKIFRQILGDF